MLSDFEYFDVVDKNRVPQNYIKKRNEKMEYNQYNVGIEVWFFYNKKVLITQRSETKSHPGKWEAPGGCLQAGESSIDGVIREIKEEIGINIDSDQVKLIGTKLYKHQFVDIYISNINIHIEDIKLQTEEVSGVKFVDLKEFEKMAENNEIVTSVLERFKFVKEYIQS